MKNNQLTSINEGSTHENNKYGGVPVGGNNTVEQGETINNTGKNKYVYSNRLFINENLTKDNNLPSYIKGKSFSKASEEINNKFKDRNDKHSLETKNVFLDRLKQAQETVKQQEQQRAEQIAQSMQSNQQEVPDMMNGQIPEGMEEFTEQNQMFMGGDFNLAEAGNITGGLSGLGGKASPYLGAASGAMSLGSLAQGNGASTNKAQSAFSGAATGAQAGMAFGPWGAGIGAAVGLGAGLLGANKAQKQQATNLRNNANSANLTDNFAKGGYLTSRSSQYDDGGYLEEDPTNPLFKPTNTIPQVGAGNVLSKPPIADDLIKPRTIEQIQAYQLSKGIAGPGIKGYGNFGPKTTAQFELDKKNWTPETPDTSMLKPQEQPFVEPTGVRQSMEDYYQKNKTTDTSDTQDNQGNWLDRNGGKFLKYAPVAMNAYQLAKLKKPAYTRLDRLTNRFKPEYVDEQSLQNIANSEMNNSINSISQLGGSQGAVRNAILGAGLNKTKALSNAYMDASAQNRQTNMVAQQFNLGVDQANIGQANQELDINDRNQANYRNEKSKYLGAIGTDLGSIGKEEVNKNQIAAALGYDVNGDYVVNKKTGEKMLTKDFEEKVKNGTLNKKYNFGDSNKLTNSSINYTPNTNFKIGRI